MSDDLAIYDGLPQHDAAIDGFNVHYVDTGEGFPVVLVHGSPTSSFVFRHQIASLSERFRVVAPDLLGFGQSDAPWGGTAFRQQAEVLRCLLDKLGLERYALVGHDWGGPVGMACASQRPEQVEKLALMNTSIRPELRPPWYWWPLRARGVGELTVVWLNLFGIGLPTSMRAAWRWSLYRAYLKPLVRVDTRRTVLNLERLVGYRELMDEVLERLPAMQAPTLILWGEGDPYFPPSEREYMGSLFPQARIQRIPKGGHFAQEDAPEIVTEALASFLG